MDKRVLSIGSSGALTAAMLMGAIGRECGEFEERFDSLEHFRKFSRDAQKADAKRERRRNRNFKNKANGGFTR